MTPKEVAALYTKSEDELVAMLADKWTPNTSAAAVTRILSQVLLDKLESADFSATYKILVDLEAILDVRAERWERKPIHMTQFGKVYWLALERCQSMADLLMLRKHMPKVHGVHFLTRAAALAGSLEELRGYIFQHHPLPKR